VSYTERWYPTGNYSSRGSDITQITFHTSEGSDDGDNLAGWIQNPASQVSYHAAVDNYQPDLVFRFVDSDSKAWSQAAGNPWALSVCFCTPSGAASGWSRDTWLSKGWMLNSGAAIARTFCDWYGIPIKALNNSQSQSGQPGINQHVNGGSSWGGHTDCGNGFPMDVMLQKISGSQPATPPAQKEAPDMTAAVCYLDGQAHFACVGKENNSIYYKGPGEGWGIVDPGSNAQSGLTIAASNDGFLVIAYTNQANNVCSYHTRYAGPGEHLWTWSNQGGQAK
jgi:hypothetical protein